MVLKETSNEKDGRLKDIKSPAKGSRRFDLYDPRVNLREIDRVGLANNETEFDLGTPSLERDEYITLFGRCSTKESVYLKLKWRPFKISTESKAQHAVIESEFELELQGQHYRSHELYSYRPIKSNVRPNRILQYGSPRSNLKFIILAPYRRMRILFTGYMENKDPDLAQEIKFVKVNLMAFPTCGVFDFFDEYDQNFLSKQFKSLKKNSFASSFKEALKKLVLYDQHEQMVQIKGDCSIRHQDGTKTSQTIYVWGLYSREFPKAAGQKDDQLVRKSIFVHSVDGRAFKLVQASKGDLALEFGYSAFLVRIQTVPMANKFTVDWSKVDTEKEDFGLQIKVANQGKTLECKVSSRESKFSRFLNAEIDVGRAAYGFVSVESEAMNHENITNQAIEACRMSYTLKVEELQLLDQAPTMPLLNTPLLLDICQKECSLRDLVGSKAASLSQLTSFQAKGAHNFLVPHGIVLTRYSYELIHEENQQSISEAINNLEQCIRKDSRRENYLSLLRVECEKLEKLFQTIQIPERLKNNVKDKLIEIYGDEDKLKSTSFAIRSSSWAEDDEDLSAAGQLKTLLNIKGLANIYSAIMSCFASKFTLANIQYKHQRGLPLDLPMAVVIQEMVNCDKAGVMFTCEPTTGDPSVILLTANYGLGESVVSGQTEPDSILLECDLKSSGIKIKDISIGSKSLIVHGSDDSSERKPEDEHDRKRCCLSEEEILQVAACGNLLADYYQSERDIEWGLKGSVLYLFQSRPITGLDSFSEFELMHEADRPSRAEVDFFTRANLGEVLPYAIKPITISHSFRSWQLYTSRLEKRFRPNLKICPHSSMEMIVNSYHPFMSMRNSLMMTYRNDKNEIHDMAKSFQLSFFGHHIDPDANEDVAQSGLEGREERNIGLLLVVLKLLTMDLRLMPDRIVDSQRKRIDKLRENCFARIEEIYRLTTGNEMEKMIKLYELNMDLLEHGGKCWRNHGMTIVISNEYNSNLITLLSKYIKDESLLYATMGKFLALSENVISGEIPRRIRKISEMIRERGHAESFSQLSLKEALKYFSLSDVGEDEGRQKEENDNNGSCKEDDNDKDELVAEFHDFLKVFGHRCYNEFEVGASSWRKDPSRIVDMLKKNLSRKQQQQLNSTLSQQQIEEDTKPLDTSNGVFEKEEEKVKAHDEDNSIDRVINSIGVNMSLMDKLRLKYVIVPNCQKFVSIRERTKDTFIALFDIMREAAACLARELFNSFRIPDEDLYFYLFLDELKPLIKGAQPGIVMHAQRRRNMFKKNFKNAWKFDEIIRDHTCQPNHLKQLASNNFNEKLLMESTSKLHGTTASCGRVQGRVCVVENYDELDKVMPGDILLAHSTDIAFSPVFPIISGIITEVGGLISHGAVVAREYGLPSIIGVPNVTKIVADGEEIILDADQGTIIRLGKLNNIQNHN